MNKITTTIKAAFAKYFYPITATVNWFKRLNYIVNHYDQDKIEMIGKLEYAESNAAEAVQLIKERTNIHADVDVKLNTPTQVIAIGRYRNHDYIQVFSIHANDFSELVLRLKSMEKYGNLQRIDSPIELRGVFERDVSW